MLFYQKVTAPDSQDLGGSLAEAETKTSAGFQRSFSSNPGTCLSAQETLPSFDEEASFLFI